jgi:hypothetical protein
MVGLLGSLDVVMCWVLIVVVVVLENDADRVAEGEELLDGGVEAGGVEVQLDAVADGKATPKLGAEEGAGGGAARRCGVWRNGRWGGGAAGEEVADLVERMAGGLEIADLLEAVEVGLVVVLAAAEPMGSGEEALLDVETDATPGEAGGGGKLIDAEAVVVHDRHNMTVTVAFQVKFSGAPRRLRLNISHY